jgi:hypothetical protein
LSCFVHRMKLVAGGFPNRFFEHMRLVSVCRDWNFWIPRGLTSRARDSATWVSTCIGSGFSHPTECIAALPWRVHY